MRVGIVNTFRREGGASIAACRLEQALQKHAGIVVDEVSRFFREDGQKCDRLAEGLDREGLLVDELCQRFLDDSCSGRSNTLFSSEFPAWDVSSELSQADVVNVHWVAHFLNVESLRRLHALGKPIVWTMHDQRPFTGGCHYSAGCSGYQSECRDCPQLKESAQRMAHEMWQSQRAALSDLPLTFVSPSRWLADCLKESSVFREDIHDVAVIPNSVDTEIFRPLDDATERRRARRRFGLPKDSFCIVAGSVTWSESRKGAKQLESAMRRFAEGRQSGDSVGAKPVCLVTYGHQERALDVGSIRQVHVGQLEGDKSMATLLACSDVYASMTREDNLPNTIMEALACGLPVLATRVGGVPEMVRNGHNGGLVALDDEAGMAEAVASAVCSPETVESWSCNARNLAETEFAQRVQAERYADLFEGLIGKSVSAASGETDPKRAANTAGPPLRIPSDRSEDALLRFAAREIDDALSRNRTLAGRVYAIARSASRKIVARFRSR